MKREALLGIVLLALPAWPSLADRRTLSGNHGVEDPGTPHPTRPQYTKAITVPRFFRSESTNLGPRSGLGNPTSSRELTVYFDYFENGQLKGGVSKIPLPVSRSTAVQGDDYLSEWPVTTLVDSGPSWNRIDVVFVGDGYTASELDSYASDVESIVSGFFAEEPFASYRPYFNVHRVDVVSDESGVDELDKGIERETALDMGFGVVGTERTLSIDTDKAQAAVSNTPDVDLVIALANSDRYGGAGYPDLVTVAGGTFWAAEIALHECGHSFADLADEYDYADGSVYTESEPSEMNVSIYDATEQMTLMTKWYRWLDYPGVGTYEGAYYHQYGIYRPTATSMMRSIDQPFGPVNAEQLLISLYQWVGPIDDATPAFYEPYPSDTMFFVTPLQPVNHSLDVQWSIDGTAIPGADDVTFTPSTLSPGIHTVGVTVIDSTMSVRDEDARQTRMAGAREWQVESEGTADEPDLYDAGEPWSGFWPQRVNEGQFGQSFSVYCDVRNGGSAAAGSFTVRFYASTDSSIGESDYYIGDVDISGLPTDGVVDCEWSGDFATTIPAGTYYLGWMIDADAEVSEANENDNSAYKHDYQLIVEAVSRHTLAVSSTAGGSVSTPGEGSFQYDHGTVVTITAFADADYHFLNWTGTAVTAGRVTNPSATSTAVTIDDDYTLQANFERSSPAITAPTVATWQVTDIGQTATTLWGRVVDDGGEGCSYRFRYRRPGGAYAYTIWTGTKHSGESFSTRVSGLAAGSTYLFNAQARNSVWTTQWGSEQTFDTLAEIVRHTLTISSSDGGSVTIPGEGVFYCTSGLVVSIRATAQPDYDFVNWTGTAVDAGRVGDSHTSDTTVTVDADYAIRANFSRRIQASIVLLSPNGGNTLIAGSIVPINWEVQGPIDAISIELSVDGGSSWTHLAYATGASGPHNWQVPSVISDQCLVSVTSLDHPGVFDTSDAPFSMQEPIARTWHVDASARGSDDGTNWEDAFVCLQEALDTARAGDEVWVAQGLYWPDLGGERTLGDRTATFQLKNAVAVYAGFPPGGSEWEQRTPWMYETILSGEIGIPDADADNSYHVVTGSHTDETAALDGFIITAGRANGGVSPGSGGGGLYNFRGSPTVRNCTFVGNSADAEGGGILNREASPTIVNSVFVGNVAESGGGVANIRSAVTFINCVFNGNVADSFGGGLYNEYEDVTLINCTLNGNEARSKGGGVFGSMCTTTVVNSVLWGNIHRERVPFTESAQVAGDGLWVMNYCCVQGWTGKFGGIGNLDADPLFIDVNGPDSTLGTLDDDLRLQMGSPCADAGDNLAVPADVTTDLEGNRRITNDIVDIGAYESQLVPGLLVHWTLDETQGTLVQDSAGDNHGTVYGAHARSGPSWRPGAGRVNGALECDGRDDYVVNQTIADRLNGLHALTVALWVRSDVTNTDRGFIHLEDPHGTDDRGMRYDAQGGSGGGVNLIKIGVTSNAPGGRMPGRQQLESSSDIQTTEWQHVAMTWSSGRPLHLYVNGTLDTPTFNEQGLIGSLTGYTKLIVGRGGKYGSPSTDARGWDGLIDDVRIYNRALGPEQIRELVEQDVPKR